MLLQLRIDAPGLQQHRGLLTWSQGQGRPHQFEFAVLANGQPQRLVLPVGAHPGWQGDVRAVQLYLSDAVAAETTLLDAQVITRPPWAVDALLLRWLYPLLPQAPPWPHLVLLVIALVGGGLALLWPYGHWRRRLVAAGLALGGGVSLIALGSYVGLLLQVVPRYDGLNGTAAALRAPSYHDSPLLNAQLVQAAGQLPAGTVLMRASDEAEYRVLRARYLFHPRPVLPIAPAGTADPVPQLIAQGATALIGDSGEPQPAPGWQQLTALDGPLVIWYNPAAVHLPPDPSPGAWAMPRLLLSLLLLWGAGWALAGMVGLRGGLRVLPHGPVASCCSAG